MYLEKLTLVNFKNHAETELEFSPEINCLIGDNGAGKTNVLDAIYYLSFCKSFFNPIDSQNIRYGEPFFVIQGAFDLDGRKENIYCGLKRGQKKAFKRNKKEYERLSEHIGLLPLVMISPADSELVYAGSDMRRKFLDGILAQFDKSYLDHLLQYNKAIAQRNALLKHQFDQRLFNDEDLHVWDMQLEAHGLPIYEARNAFLDDFIPLFQSHYEKLGQGREEVTLRYDSQLHESTFPELAEAHRKRDRAVQYTTAGIHKDDLTFLIEDRPLKKFGSQGQQKSFLIALKLAQFEYIRDRKGVKPLLLLDDIFDKLDPSRVEALLQLVSEHAFGQTFVTDANKERIEDLFERIAIHPRVFKIQSSKETSDP